MANFISCRWSLVLAPLQEDDTQSSRSIAEIPCQSVLCLPLRNPIDRRTGTIRTAALADVVNFIHLKVRMFGFRETQLMFARLAE